MFAAVVLVAAVLLYPRIRELLSRKPGPPPPKPAVTLVEGTTNALRVAADVGKRLGIRTAEAREATIADTLKLNGSLTLDANRLEEVRSRFDGEVVEIAKVTDGGELLFGHRVKSGQLLAVVWSRELGEKKSELVDALSQQHLDTETLKRLEKLYEDGTISERQYRDQERAVENDRITVSRVLRTLQTWRVADEEIKEVQTEADRVIAGATALSGEQAQQWARVELHSALDGVILERNVAVGDIVTTTDDLFKVADLSRFRVLAYAYEEDLPSFDALPVEQRRWTITVPADPGIPAQQGKIEQIGRIIDPMQHTALVMGWVENKDERLRAGQFVTATVELPPPGNEVVLPASALIEKGGEKLVFVQTSSDPVYTQRRVSVSRQLGARVCFHIVPPGGNEEAGIAGINPGEQIVVSGAIELQQALTDLISSRPSPASSPVN
jgi:cobalt-zinc-cadmium efflux system membrane fusion protein